MAKEPPTMLAMDILSASRTGLLHNVSVMFLDASCHCQNGNPLRSLGMYVLNCSRIVHVEVAQSSMLSVAAVLLQLEARSMLPAVTPAAATASRRHVR